MKDVSLIRGFEERGMNAWPAQTNLLIDGWMLRLSGGASKRANSASAYSPFPRPAQAIVPALEEIYAKAGQPCVIKHTPLAHAGDLEWLHARGYKSYDESLVLDLKLDNTLDYSNLTSLPPKQWLEELSTARVMSKTDKNALESIINGIRIPAIFASIRREDQTVAWGMAVVERGLVGLFNLYVAEPDRNQGLGQALSQGLMAWGRANGAFYAYLQTLASNHQAQSLTSRMGFQEVYRYAYLKT